MNVGDILARPLDKKIEEIIKVDQKDEESVISDIEEYVATDSIKRSYKELLKAIAESPSDPHEGIGIWISGFFGSGKSFFAKNLGYILENPTIFGKPFSEYFKKKIGDDLIGDFVDSINTRIPTEVIMFDVSAEKAVMSGNQGLAEIMYRVLLRQLGYAEDFDIVDLEIELEEEGKLEKFMELCFEEYDDWKRVRKGAQKFTRASAILHKMEKETYPEVDTWSKSIYKESNITVKEIVDRVFELMSRRRKGKALAFIIDEVGQYIARSDQKIEDLRVVVEQFGKVSKNKMKNKEIIAPVWIAVTSQEKLDDVVAEIDSKKIRLATLQDRFKYRIDLKPADIREVASKRVLGKKETAIQPLCEIFNQSQGRLNSSCKLENSNWPTEITEEKFIRFYPYLPYYIDLSINIMSGIRLQPGAPRHFGGSNRTIIKQAYEMMINERTNMANKPLGSLVSLDLIYELVESNISTEKQMDINQISTMFQNDKSLGDWPIRVAKAICLLEFVKNLPRTEHNIAAVLVDNVESPLAIDEVRTSLEKLENAQFIRLTDEGYKLQTAQEKNWESEKSSFSIKQKDRNEISRDVMENIATDNNFVKYRYKGMKNFNVKISINGVNITEGQIPFNIQIAEDEISYATKLDEIISESRIRSNNNELYWIFSLNNEIDNLFRKYNASDKMIIKYEQLRAQNKITNEESSSLSSEMSNIKRLKIRLTEKIKDALSKGQGVFQGVTKDASAIGKNLPEIIKKFLDYAVPELYPKLEMGAKPLSGKEAEEILKAVNLKALSQVFYNTQDGFDLVIKDGAKYIPNTNAEIAKEIFNYIKGQSEYGETVTGKNLEDKFSGIGYGWDRDVLRMVLAVLFRAGAIVVNHKNNRYSDYSEPESQVALIKNQDFRNASFVPHKPLDLKIQTTAVTRYQELTGKDIDVDSNAISKAIEEFAKKEKESVVGDYATSKAENLKVQNSIKDYQNMLNSLISSGRDDRVKFLAEQGKTLKDKHDEINNIHRIFTDQNLTTIKQARVALSRIWVSLKKSHTSETLPDVEKLQDLIASEELYDHLNEIKVLVDRIFGKYKELISEKHEIRNEVFSNAIDKIKGRIEYTELDKDSQDSVLAQLKKEICENLDLLDGEVQCKNCSATLDSLENNIISIDRLKGDVLTKIQAIVSPKQRIERIKLSHYINSALETEEDVNDAIERLKQELMKIIAKGATIIVE